MAKAFRFHLDRFHGLYASRDRSYDISESESPDMLNFKVTQGYRLKKRDGFFRVFQGENVRGLWYGSVAGKQRYLAVCQNRLFASEEGFDSLVPLSEEIPGTGEVRFFSFYRALYLLTGEKILCYDGENVSPLEPYVPLVMVATPPAGDGVPFQEVNLLTRTVRQTFSPTGTDRFFRPAVPVIDEILSVKINGEEEELSSCVWDPMSCTIQFLVAPEKGTDNVEICYRIAGEEVSDRIHACRFALGFGGANDTRAFLYGNPNAPEMRYHSGVVDGEPCMEYFPETAYTLVGSGKPVTAILRHYDRQLIFTEDSAYYSYLSYMEGADGKQIASFPVLPLSDERGNLPFGEALLVENEPCTLTSAGLCRWVSSNVRDERNAVLFSQPISLFLEGKDLRGAKLFHRKETGELYLLLENLLLVYQYAQKVFYRYQVPLVRSFCQGEKEFFFSTENGIYQVGGSCDDGEKIPAYWRSRALLIGEEEKRKDLHSVRLYARSPGEAAISVILHPEDREKEEKALFCDPEKEMWEAGFRSKVRSFRTLALEIRADGDEAVHLFGVTLRGKVTDGMGKE